MNEKIAYSAAYGREIAARFFAASEIDAIEKTAEEIDETDAQVAAAVAEDIAYRDVQSKLAHNAGALTALVKVAEALESQAFDRKAFLKDVQETIKEAEASFGITTPENEDEEAQMIEAMHKSAAEALAAFTGSEVDDSIADLAAQIVAAAALESEG